MNSEKENYTAGIFMPTMNRPDFVIRQLKYYAAVRCPHTIYIGDSSNQEHSNKLKGAISGFDNQLKIVYKYLPNLNNREANLYLLSMIKEPYACFIGDDDYQIPNSVTRCIQFLENNPDYSTAGGYAVSFRLTNNGVRGELKRLADYQRPYVKSDTAGERITEYFRNYYVPLFSVHRTGQMLKNFEKVGEIKDISFGAELLPSALAIVAGKSATLDCLGFVRQIHDSHLELPSAMEWTTSPKWNESYQIFENEVSRKISEKDKIPPGDAVKITKQAFQLYLQKYLAWDHAQHYPIAKNTHLYKKILSSMRHNITKALPFIRYAYRTRIKPELTGKKEMHYEVLRIGSRYYDDFKPVMDSFTDPSPKNL